MKVIPIALAPQYAAAGSTLCVCVKVTRSDAVVIGFTSLDVPLTVSGVVYEPGFEPGEIAQTSGLAVDNLEMTVLPDTPGGLLLDMQDLVTGLWNGAEFEIFEVNWKSPTDGINILKRGRMGDAQATRGAFTIELRGLKQALQQSVGEVTSKTCRARLGDARCKVDLAPLTHEYATTSVASRHVVTCSAAVEASDYYGEGTALGLTGPNAGHSRKVKSFAAGVFTFSLSFDYTIGVGDTFRFVAGCRKRLIEDCKTKHNNVPNNQSDPHVPGADIITADPDPAG